LTKAADFYEASTVEAPILLDVLLNPGKHNAGEEAENARRVTEKIFQNAGADVKLLRSELEKYLAKQAKISDSSSKTLGQNLQKVLDNARVSMSILGDSFVSTEGLVLSLCKEDTLFTREQLAKQDVKYNDILDAVKKMREQSGPAISRSAENLYDALNKYGIDFTERAREGKLDPGKSWFMFPCLHTPTTAIHRCYFFPSLSQSLVATTKSVEQFRSFHVGPRITPF
jgi:ATP-dependent Clp protease ATP-binding subunit ClpB